MTKTEYRSHFDSLSAVSEYISATPRKWPCDWSESASPGADWDLNAGLPGALLLARDGWRDGARNLASGLERLRPTQTVTRRSYSPAGSHPHPVRFATGNPRCMARSRPESAPKPAITIAVQLGASGATSAQHMSNYGLAVASYVESLSRQGFPVEVIAGDVYNYSSRRLVVSWVVKRINAPMNFADMAFSLGHPAAMRRISFAVSERQEPCQIDSSYGGTGPLTPEDFKGRKVVLLNGMASAGTHSRTPEQALEGVKASVQEALRGFGVEVGQ